jgi:hypothetical protein
MRVIRATLDDTIQPHTALELPDLWIEAWRLRRDEEIRGIIRRRALLSWLGEKSRFALTC